MQNHFQQIEMSNTSVSIVLSRYSILFANSVWKNYISRYIFCESTRFQKRWILVFHGSVHLPEIKTQRINMTNNAFMSIFRHNLLFSSFDKWYYSNLSEYQGTWISVRLSLLTFCLFVCSSLSKHNHLLSLPFTLAAEVRVSNHKISLRTV